LSFYYSLGFDVRSLFKIECGVHKILSRGLSFNLETESEPVLEEELSSVDVLGSLSLSVSLAEGIALNTGVKRGNCNLSVPIKLCERANSLPHLLVAAGVPSLVYAAYKMYFKARAERSNDVLVRRDLNVRGEERLNRRRMALRQQAMMEREAKVSRGREETENGLVILAAFYGANVEQRMCGALRRSLGVDEENEENEEKETEIGIETDTETKGGDVPPLLFGGRNGDTEKETERASERMELSEVDWDSVEPGLEGAMLSGVDWVQSEDVHFPSLMSVRTVLQYLVGEGMSEESRLVLSSGTKVQCPGFYDCAGAERKNELVVVYRWKDECRMVAVDDVLPLTLPNERHAQWIDLN